MSAREPRAFNGRQLAGTIWLLVALWTLAVGASATWGVRLLRDTMVDAAVHDARNSFNKDVLYRKWAASHGGVYVPVTATTQPNPHLADVAERDLVTPSGRRLTLMNPAYMTRQIHELESKASGTQGHITSLKPIRAENAPDAIWYAKHHEVSKYFSVTNHFRTPVVVVMNKAKFDALPPEYKDILLATARDTEEWSGSLYSQVSAALLASLKKGGMTVVDADEAAFRKAVEPVYAKHAEKFGAQLKAISEIK